MATKSKVTKNGKTKAPVNRIADVQEKQCKLQPMRTGVVSIGIKGISPYVQHQWSEKSKRQIREKGAGKKSRDREVRKPEEEAHAATYFMSDGKTIGVPAMAIKKAILTAAHKDIGIERTLVKKSLFIKCEDMSGCVELEFDQMVVREDTVRVGNGAADLRYRPEFHGWRCTVKLEIDFGLLQLDDLVTLINRAGFGVGIGEGRPEKNGEWGRFEIDSTVPITTDEA